MPLQVLVINGNPHLKDLSPLADCPLTGLYANGIPDLVDLSPLKGMRLRFLQVSGTGVRDLLPLTGIKTLEDLSIDAAISDLAPIREAKLKRFLANGSMLSSLEPLRGQPLDDVSLNQATVTSLEPIGAAPITKLDLTSCGHLDLAVLRTRQLRQLLARNTTLDHLEVLAEMTELQVITLPKNLTDPGILRKLPHLRKIDTDFGDKGEDAMKDAADFWREYDAQHAPGKK
jgi:hypothetical protein